MAAAALVMMMTAWKGAAPAVFVVMMAQWETCIGGLDGLMRRWQGLWCFWAWRCHAFTSCDFISFSLARTCCPPLLASTTHTHLQRPNPLSLCSCCSTEGVAEDGSSS